MFIDTYTVAFEFCQIKFKWQC